METETQEVKLHLPCYLTGFMLDIERMNQMYELAPIEKSWNPMVTRLMQFRKIIGDEVAEFNDIQDVLNTANDDNAPRVMQDAEVMMADILGDIIVYCASEAARWGIPIDRVLHIIMQSNWSKLGLDGKPIKDPDTGKFLKGPNYWKPEPKIAELLNEKENSHD